MIKADIPSLKAKLTLVFWYTVLVEALLIPFSIHHYQNDTKDLEKYVLNRDFGRHVPRFITAVEYNLIYEQIDALKRQSARNLIQLNLGMVATSALVMFFVASKTLKPITDALKREKEFVSNISHELRTPIMSISMASEVALRQKKPDVLTYKNYLAQINDTAVSASTMIGKLLNMTRMEAGVIKLKKEAVSLTKLLEKIQKDYLTICDKRGLNLELLKPGNNVVVKADSNFLNELITIYLDNAVKYTQPKGSIKLILKEGKAPSIEIKDTGIGIPQDELQQINERFYRATNAKKFADGSGLGLAIGSWIAKNSNIHVNITSKLNEGTAVTLVFKQQIPTVTI